MEMTQTTGRSPSSGDVTVVSRDVTSDCDAATLRRHRHWPAPEPIRGRRPDATCENDISTPSSGKKTDLRLYQGNRLTSLYPIQEKLTTGPQSRKSRLLPIKERRPTSPIPHKGYIVTPTPPIVPTPEKGVFPVSIPEKGLTSSLVAEKRLTSRPVSQKNRPPAHYKSSSPEVQIRRSPIDHRSQQR